MNFASIIRIQGAFAFTLSVLMLLPAICAIGFGEYPQALAFGITAVLLALFSGSILTLTPKPGRRANVNDALAAAIFSWIVASIVSAPPFVIGVANTSILSAIHEAVSCVTTTGHSVIEIGDGGWPVSLILWRGILHIVGAILTLSIAASVFAAINLGGPGIHRTELFTIPSGSFFGALPRVLSATTIFILSLISVFTILLVLSGVSGPYALSASVSAITTGLVNPVASPSLGPVSFAFQYLALIFGTLGLFFALSLRRLNILDSVYDPEVFAFAFLMLAFTLLAMFAGLGTLEGAAWSLSSLSTSGLDFNNQGISDQLPVSLLVLPALIGGASLSAAGGIKLGRFVILIRRAAQEFGSLGFRGSLVKFTYRGRSLEESSVIGVWVYLIGYISAVVLLLCALSFSGSNFESSVPTAIGAISNSGALIDGDISNGHMHVVLIIAMLLGRWEVLALLPLFVPSFWRK